ncbi:MAG: MiaB-like tRNA modifying enzyme [Acidobacteriaceae bacterium]|nr:MiaB-like tRNA modifying enzyme [Acidobacteriaceae bacterium]
MPSFYVQNFGCRTTQADGAAIERQFLDHGLDQANSPAEASLVVLNSCTVTASADQEARAAIRRIHRANPICQIVVTGCYAQRAPEEVASLPGVSRVIGNSHKHLLAGLAGLAIPARDSAFVPLSSLSPDDRSRIFVSDIFAHTELLAAPVFGGHEHTRPILKVQDGCDNRCSFCVIPSVRGHSRSLPLDRILDEVNALVKEGFREVVISGINLGRWGRDLPGIGHPRSLRFEDLVRAILCETSLEKLRISSVEPMDWSDELIQLIARSPRIAKHAHVPMQSGSDRVLRLMHRKYRPWHYHEKIEKIRAAMPTAAIGADIMVGFPGESESDFDATRRTIEELPFTYLHVFTYSSRPGTPSATMPEPVLVHIARERNRILRELAAEKKSAFMKTFVSQTMEAITLNAFDGEYTEALTDNYLRLRLNGKHGPNQKVMAQVESVKGEALVGRACHPELATATQQSSMCNSFPFVLNL